MPQVSFGCQPPALKQCMNPEDKDFFWVSWVLLSGETITSSGWDLPAGFNLLLEDSNLSVIEFETGVVYNNCNVIKLSTTLTSGIYTIYNKIKTSANRELKRGFTIQIK